MRDIRRNTVMAIRWHCPEEAAVLEACGAFTRGQAGSVDVGGARTEGEPFDRVERGDLHSDTGGGQKGYHQ